MYDDVDDSDDDHLLYVKNVVSSMMVSAKMIFGNFSPTGFQFPECSAWQHFFMSGLIL